MTTGPRLRGEVRFAVVRVVRYSESAGGLVAIATAVDADPKVHVRIAGKTASADDLFIGLVVDSDLHQHLFGNVVSEIGAGSTLSVVRIDHVGSPLDELSAHMKIDIQTVKMKV